jgi:hypothetical protein
MKSFGGLYLDVDVECYTSVDSWLRGYDLILQSDYEDGHDIQNGVFASVPGHKYWDLVIDLLYQKSNIIIGQEGKEMSKVCHSLPASLLIVSWVVYSSYHNRSTAGP